MATNVIINSRAVYRWGFSGEVMSSSSGEVFRSRLNEWLLGRDAVKMWATGVAGPVAFKGLVQPWNSGTLWKLSSESKTLLRSSLIDLTTKRKHPRKAEWPSCKQVASKRDCHSPWIWKWESGTCHPDALPLDLGFLFPGEAFYTPLCMEAAGVGFIL